MRTSRLTHRVRPRVRRPLLLEQLEGRVNPSTLGQLGNLIVNPGFETGDFSGWKTAAAPYSSYFGVDGSSHGGNYAAYFGSYLPPDRDDIYQDVPTTPGHTYHISYWVANDGGGSTEIRSSWGGAVLEDLFPDNAFPYEQHAFDVTANSASTEFRIGGYQAPALWHLDDVSVTDVTSTQAGPFVTGQTPTGTVLPAVHDMTVSFSVPVQVSGSGGFDPSKITNLTGPAPYSVDTVTAVSPSGGLASSFDVHFAGAGLTAAGDYSFHIGPNITDAGGNSMDQDRDGPPLGQPDDYYLATLTIGRPAVVSSSPTGTKAPTVPNVHATFSEPVLVSSFDTSKITAFTRNGVNVLGDIASVAATNQVGTTASEFDIHFAAGLEKATGVYSMTIGPKITDAYGNAMAAAFTTGFNIDGPRVTAVTPTGSLAGPVSSETVTFSRPMQVGTFTSNQVTLTGPGGPITVTVTPVSPSGGAATQFTLGFAAQKASGVYTTTIGPNVQDTFGNAMDQNGNFIPGEVPGDQFQSTFTITPVPAGNLIVNPGFETGDFTGWKTVAAPYSSYFGVAGSSHGGSYAAYFGSYLPPDRDEIYQNVPTIPGHTYHISYWVANGGGGGGSGWAEIRSSWGGTVLEDFYPDNAFGYQQHTFDVTASSASTEFRIGGYQVPSLWYLDDVSVTDTTPGGTSPAVMNTGIADAAFAATAPGPRTAEGGGRAAGPLWAQGPGGFTSPDNALDPAVVRALVGQQAGAGGLAPASAREGAPARGLLSGVDVRALDQVFASRRVQRTFSPFGEDRPASDLGDDFSLPGLPA